jgi:hypothetical protein
MRGPLEQRELHDLKTRLEPVCQRTLRRQVQEYVKFTARIPITQDFTPTDDEQLLYQLVSEYLQRDDIQALPLSQRKLMTLVLRKLLASSTFAIGQTLGRMIERIKEKNPDITGALEDDFETLDEIAEELQDSESDSGAPVDLSDSESILAEVRELARYRKLAESITVNSKGDALLEALSAGFAKLEDLGAARKAVIFTESRRTQEYLVNLLNENGYEGKFLTINGTNADDRSGAIYKQWLERHQGESVVTGNKAVDLRAALVEHFRLHAEILIATEAAAEGVNLQFCSLVVNYDLPWNPQRIEQRIGRCHRYGQKFDVVVINFLNRSNEADLRVFQLLDEKFKLFQGVFGSSDEVLGALESGVDFEQRILSIVQSCRTRDEIDEAFNALQSELEEQIQTRMKQVEQDVLAHLDEAVRKRLKLRKAEAEAQMTEVEAMLYNLARSELSDVADFNDESCEFTLRAVPSGWEGVETGHYVMLSRKNPQGVRVLRLGSPLAEALLARAKEHNLEPGSITFAYDPRQGRKVEVEPYLGKSGILSVAKLTITSGRDTEERLVFAAVDADGNALHWKAARALLSLPASACDPSLISYDAEAKLQPLIESGRELITGERQDRNSTVFSAEIEKLERWADDLKHGLEVEIKDLRARVNQLKKDFRLAQALEHKLAIQKELRDVEKQRDRKQLELYKAQDDIDAKKEGLIDEVESQLKQREAVDSVLCVAWTLAEAAK